MLTVQLNYIFDLLELYIYIIETFLESYKVVEDNIFILNSQNE